MIGDLFTKPLTEAKFRRFKNIVINCDYYDISPVNKMTLYATTKEPIHDPKAKKT